MVENNNICKTGLYYKKFSLRTIRGKSVIFFLAILLTLLLASCENPWIADIFDPLLNPIVTFNSNGGTPVDPVRVQRGSDIDTPPVTQREGFSFNGWHTSWALNNPVDFPYTVNERTTLYASWTTSVPAASLDSISAIYTGTEVIYPNTLLDSLKNHLTVTAHYSDGESEILTDTAYRLSGTLNVGTSSITVTYSGKQTTFNVIVTAPIPTLNHIIASYTGTSAIYPTTPLDALKAGLTVTAHHSDGTSETLNYADYELDGTLTVGANIPITVKYGGRETTFTVTVTLCSHNYTWEITTPLTAGIGVETESCTLCGDVKGTRHFTTLASPPPGLVLTLITAGANSGTYSVKGQNATGAVVIPGWVHETDGTIRQITTIGNMAFYWEDGNENITSVIIHEGVTVIGNYAFNESSTLASVTFPSSLTTIGDGAFGYCPNLTNIIIPANVSSIGNDAFAGCSKLNITVHNDNLNYASEGGILYNKDKSILIAWPIAAGDITIPNSVTTIGSTAFTYTGITSINFSNVTSIGSLAFYGCRGLTSLTIPSSVTDIGHNAFRMCSNLESVIIESNGFSFSELMFGECNSLTSVTLGHDAVFVNVLYYDDLFPAGASLVAAYETGGAGTYTRDPGGDVWEKLSPCADGHDESTKLANGLCARPGCTSPLLYTVGLTGPGDGIIFYVDPVGFTVEMVDPTESYTAHYLEAAPEDSGIAAWGANSATIPGVSTNDGGINIIGTGRKDTQIIVAYLLENPESDLRAAQIAIAEPFGGQNDWFLPCAAELYQLYINRSFVENIDENTTYSSSSQSNEISGWISAYNFRRGEWNEEPRKVTPYSVRAIRAF